jgi:hypothetical protein
MATKFSGATKAHLSRLMGEYYTMSTLNTLFTELDLSGYDLGGGSKEARSLRVINAIEDRFEEELAIRAVQTLLRRVVEGDIAPRLPKRPSDYKPPWLPQFERLLTSLEADGWEFHNGRLLPSSPEPVSLAEEITALEAELEELGSPEALKHYKQAVGNFQAGPGNEEACNGQLRNLLDVVFLLVCERLSGKHIKDANGAIQHLRNKKLIEDSVYELLHGIYGLSNTRGAHVGLSDTEEALFRLHLTTAVARYLLRLTTPT